MLAVARTTKLTATSKEHIEDETDELGPAAKSAVETEFFGGEQINEPENEDGLDGAWAPACAFQPDKLIGILSRRSELAAASKPGPKTAAVKQMKIFDDRFHAVLNAPVPANQSEAQKPQFCYGCPHSSNVALLHQDAILKEMRNAQQRGEIEVNP